MSEQSRGRPDEEPLLTVKNLRKYYDSSGSIIDSLFGRVQKVKAVDGVDLELYRGETVGVVGESGCGKSTLGQTLLRLQEPTDGEIYLRDERLNDLSQSELRDRRKDIQYIFQDPFASLNPRLTVGDIIGEPLDIHDIATGEQREERIRELLDIVGLNPSHTHRYPHEFSGGQRQRIGIARALAVDPEIIVCDEPVSALDVSVQAQILNLLDDLQTEFDLSYIFIAHDLSVVEHISDRIAVMYLGEFAEVGTAEEVFQPPHHPYTEALLSAIPEPDPLWEGEQIFLPGNVPSPLDPPTGCRFHTRCPRIIQPEAFDLEQDVWRSLVDLSLRVENARTVEAVAALTEDDRVDDGERVDPTEASRDELDRLVREEFDLPDRLEDPQAESVVTDVVENLYGDDVDGARERLAAAPTSPCVSEQPAAITTAETHEIACHLYDDEYAAGPPEPRENETG
jgi:peptide/nickel transport system ATP-binding protein